MKIISNVYDLRVAIKKNYKKIYLSSDLYDWLLCSNWCCILGDKLREYSKMHEIIRVEKIREK